MLAWRKVPVWLIEDPVMDNLTSAQRDMVFCAMLAKDSRHCLPYAPAPLRSKLMPGRPFVALKDIAAARDRLVALGVFLHKRGARKEWLEIATAYRAEEGVTETFYGESEAGGKQSEMAFSEDVKPPPARKSNSQRLDQTKTINDSRASAQESGSRGLSAGEESGMSFSKSERDFINATPLYPESTARKFFEALSTQPDEVTLRGSLWLRRWKHDAQTLYASASDFLAMPKDKQKTANFAAMATKAFKERNPTEI